MKRLLIVPLVVLIAVLAFSRLQTSEDDLMSPVTRLEVVVATEPIPAGTSAEDALGSGALEVMQLVEERVPTDAVSDPNLLTGASISALEEGAVVTSEVFG